MQDTTFITVFWNVRGEHIDECAERTLDTLTRLAEVDPGLRTCLKSIIPASSGAGFA
jgi:hypothetical protein